MSAEPSELRRGFLLVDQHTTVEEVRNRIASLGNVWMYVVVALADEQFALFRLGELIEILKSTSPTFRPEFLRLPLEGVPNLLTPRAVSTVEEVGLTPGRVRALLKDAPRRRWVVLKAGQVTGVLAAETRSGSANVDLQWLNPISVPSDARPGMDSLEPPAPAPSLASGEARPSAAERAEAPTPSPKSAPSPRPTGAGISRGGRGRMRRAEPPPARPGTLAADSAPAAEAPPAPAAEVEEEKRWINAGFEGHAASDPLRVGETYTIAFDVDLESRPDSVAAEPLLPTKRLFSDEEEAVDLTVQLASEDLEIFTEPQKLRVPRRGKSRNKARFDISPKQEGACVLNALFLKNGNFIQLMTLKLQTGKPLHQAVSSSATLGRSLDATFEMKPRDVTLVLTKTADGFQAILSKAVAAIATLPITEPQLDEMIARAREELLGVVHWEKGSGGAVYQAGIDIPPEVNAATLRAMARAGFRLFQRIFYGPAADAQSRLLGDRLRQMAQREKLKIQIFSQKFLLPWGILYMADSLDENHIDPELFLGFKHIIEHIPLQPPMDVITDTIDSRPLLNIGVNVNADIDEQMGIQVIAEQLEYWKGFSSTAAKVIVRKTREEVQKALADASSPDQLLYFYCHAVSQPLSGPGGPDAAAIVLSGSGRLTLEDLNVSAPTGKALSGAPLVFINACESAEMSPLFYDGFVPYFMAKGARGVIGTECETPALFAAEWARRFFDRFLAGKPVGETFLELRREFYQRHNNLLGLLYALYCDGDTQIVPGVAKTGGSDVERPDA